jgi:hypothetical protein
MNIYLKKENEMDDELLSEEEQMHEMQEWEEDYAEMQAEMYLDNI